MAGVAVCCPSCWAWSELGSRTTCKRCGVPLVFPDGRAVGQTVAQPGVPLESPHRDAVYAAAVSGGPPSAPAFVQAVASRRLDWVTICRVTMAVDGLLVVSALLLIGLVVRQLSIPVQGTGGTTAYTSVINIGPAFAVAAIIVGAFYAGLVWVMQFTAVRVVLLVLHGLGLLAVLSKSYVLAGSPALFGAEVVGVAIDVFLTFALLMSVLPGRRNTI